MVMVAVSLFYPWTDRPERDCVVFPLSGEYGTTAAAAHATIVRLFGSCEYVEIRDASGDPWPFYRGTVSALVTWTRRC